MQSLNDLKKEREREQQFSWPRETSGITENIPFKVKYLIFSTLAKVSHSLSRA